MLLLASSRGFACDLAEQGRGSLFEVRVSTGADLEPAEALVGDAQGGGQDGDGPADLLSRGA